MRRVAALLLVLGACGGGSDSPRGYHTADGFIRDGDGRAVILRGANLSGEHKVAPYLDYHQAADYTRLRSDWGLNSIRFLLVWAAVEPQSGHYDEAYLDRVAERLTWARAAGLLVILDMHQDIYGEGFTAAGGDGAPRWTCDEARYAAFVPRTPWFLSYADDNVVACVDGIYQRPELRAAYIAAWRHVAARFAAEPAVLGFDPFNEPYWGSQGVTDFEADSLYPLYRDIAAAVRAEAPGWLAFLEPSASRNLGFATYLPRFDIGNAVYAPHIYDRTAEGGGGFDAARRADLLATMESNAREAASLGAPLWFGEYGGVAANPGIAEYMDAVYDGTAAAGAGAMYWHYGKDGGYGLLAADGSEKPALIDAIARPYPERVAGTPVSWGLDDAGVFTLDLRPAAGIAAPTVLVLPERRYPRGYQVACGGCTVTMEPGRALLTHLSAARVTVTPM